MKLMSAKAGAYCENCDKRPSCEVISPRRGLLCTKQAGHTGDHIACAGRGQHMLEVWKNKEAKNAESQSHL
jgi:hypothetical protein